MSALVIRSLNVLLGIFFTFLGTLKITPSISKDLHKDLREEYAKFAKVLPGAKLAGVKVPSKYYRRGVGAVEILCGKWRQCSDHCSYEQYSRYSPADGSKQKGEEGSKRCPTAGQGAQPLLSLCH